MATAGGSASTWRAGLGAA
ncbi:hypothetical protein CIB84_013648 [Bambusicola thoracicus]|uniref:Uncharacterized protein n=1 Tax=Bambusicola thoracicus TaxID=9083 RepID=A0A2P4SES0_BAMTH|nr:hypothetical protein CIB84_013648 [Bambusicola thoracicus]